MKLVWKCDYCCTTDVNKDKIETHEITCVFNPSNRLCYTCDNHYEEYESQYCKIYNDYKGLEPLPTNDFDKFYGALDEHKKCDKWYNHNIKMKKLKKIKDKINEG